VHLKDVARVELGKFNYAGNSFVDGKRASYLLVYQAPGSNAIETADNVTATMEELKKSFPADIDYVVPFESVTVVKVSVHEVIETLVIALVLVIVGSVFIPAKLAYNTYPGTGYPGIYYWYVHLFYPAAFYH
jgi:multidrug efflux pump subunit AcrB